MGWLSKFLGLLLGISVAISVQAWVLNSTIWNAGYVTTKMHEAKLANQLSTVLPEVAVQITGESEETRLAMKETLTPRYLQDQLGSLTPSVLAYLRGTGPQPVLDLRDLEPQITAAGLPIPPQLKSSIENPTPISVGQYDGVLKLASLRSSQALWAGPLACIVLILLIFLTGRHRRWTTLGGSFGLAAILLGAMGALAFTPPQLMASAIDTSAGKLLTPVLRPLAESIARDQARALWVAAMISVGIAIVLYIVHFMAKTLHRREKKHKGPLAV